MVVIIYTVLLYLFSMRTEDFVGKLGHEWEKTTVESGFGDDCS